jgi:hypothetical protein
MSKYRGRNFEDYLKEKGISEEVSARAKKRWEVLRAEASVEAEDMTESPGDPPKENSGFFHRIRRGVNHLFTQSRPMRK